MPEKIILLPQPQSLRQDPGVFLLRANQFIRLLSEDPRQLITPGHVLQNAIKTATGHDWSLLAGPAGPTHNVAATLRLDTTILKPQAYRLTISPTAIDLAASDPAGLFYAAQTLAQLLRQFPHALPALTIEDHPDFPTRGVMLDISRDKVPTMETLFALVDELAALKINQLQLYTEHTFAYLAHPQVWAQASPMTGQQILELDRYCRDRFIDLVPNQNSFGHLERWLNYPQYKPLAEAPDGFDTPYDHRNYAFSLCPVDPKSIDFVRGLYDELLPHFSSPLFNVGCDETWDLGQGRSKDDCQQRGKERVYLDFLLKIYTLVKQHGRTMQFWGDIILHRPELVPELPKDIIALEWGYEADHPFDRDAAIFAAAGVPFYVCPGTSTWLSIAGRTHNALANLQSAAENGLKHGAIGYLITDWGDWGHLQYLPASYLGFAAGAAYSWHWQANRNLDLPLALSTHLFRDRAHIMGQLAHDLGNVYLNIKKKRTNSTILFWRLVGGPEKDPESAGVTAAEFAAAQSAIAAALAPLDSARMDRPDASLILDEFRNAAAMLTHACRRGLWKLDPSADDPASLAEDLSRILGEHRRLWLARNRPGGLPDSTRRLETRLDEYRRQ